MNRSERRTTRWIAAGLSLLTAGIVAVLTAPAAAQCQPDWVPTFGEAPGTNGIIEAMAVFDDGTGPALYVAGDFSRAGSVAPAGKIARWDGTSWSSLGNGSGMSNQTVQALAVFDDGSGPALYAGGSFAMVDGITVNSIARWDGQSWSPVGAGENVGVSGFVWSMTVFDDGTGPALYVGGFFSSAGGVPANRIARWDGQSWSAVGQGMAGGAGGQVRALKVFDDGLGGGPALYAAGSFLEADGATVNRIARWSGAAWLGLGEGLNNHVWDLAVWNDGSGPALYAAGEFTSAGGAAADRIARWNGSTWSALGSGLNNAARSLLVFDDGSGPHLCVGGNFTTAGAEAVNRIARWNGSEWSAFTDGANGVVTSLIAYDDGSGERFYAAGSFIGVGTGFIVDRIVRWDEDRWSGLGAGLTNAVRALAVFDDGAGPALYAGGLFVTGGGQPLLRMGRWDGQAWSVLAQGGMNNTTVHDLCVFDDGNGAALYAVGDFRTAGGVSVDRVARWDGQAWSALDGGLTGIARALAVFDDGTGPALYVGGQFLTTTSGLTVNRIARWNGQSWSALGAGMNQTVSHLVVFDDGTGPALYAGGGFTTADGVTVNRVAKWDGQAWSALGSGVPALVTALGVFDDGTGEALYVGGDFTLAGGVAANRIARWDGQQWSALGTGLNHTASALAGYDDGSGPALFVGGAFTTAGDQPANFMAKWDGVAWSPLGDGVSSVVSAMAVFDDGSPDGPALFIGGSFVSSPGGDSYLAKWQGCGRGTCPADWDGDGQVTSTDISSFITSWLASLQEGTLAADFDGNGVVNSSDVSAFITAWLEAVLDGC